MRAFGWAIGAFMLITAQATAAGNRLDRSLQMLAPEERLEQLCDYTAMARIRKEIKDFKPDRALASATAEPRIRVDTIEVKGGAFRSRGKWYSLAYTCTANPEHLKILTFHYAIGAEIPETKWAGYGLWN